MRCKLTQDYPCGDWPVHGYTWHFIPPFLLVLASWLLLARLVSWRNRIPVADAAAQVGSATSPLLGLTISWSWYGFTGPAFHPPICEFPILCHDVLSASILVWTTPWIIWAGWRTLQLFGIGRFRCGEARLQDTGGSSGKAQ